MNVMFQYGKINDLKTSVEKKLELLDKPLLVLIDDIDRLECDELFETLKIIRNTGNFKNVFYIAAYDKQYVTEQMQQKNMDGNRYLEKIFSIEVHLPHYDTYSLLEFFKIESSRMCSVETTDENLSGLSIVGEDVEMFNHIISTFRRAKNFANMMAVDFNYLQSHKDDINILPKDLFYLELLKFANIEVYDTLRSDPDKYLYVTYEREYNRLFYKLKKGLVEPVKRKDENDPWIEKYEESVLQDKSTIYILKRLFSEENRKDFCICSVDFYHAYFAMYPISSSVSQWEHSALKGGDDANRRATLHDWCNNIPRKTPASICARLMGENIQTMSEEDRLECFRILVTWLTEEPLNTYLIPNIFVLYISSVKRRNESYYTYLKQSIGFTKNHLLMARCLVALYEKTATDDARVIELESCKELISLNITFYIKMTPEWDAIDLFKDTDLQRFFDAHVLGQWSNYDSINIAYDQFYKYFKDKKSHKYTELINWRDRSPKDYRRLFGGSVALENFVQDCFARESNTD